MVVIDVQSISQAHPPVSAQLPVAHVDSCSTTQTWVSDSPGAGLLGSPAYPGLSLKRLLLFEDAKCPY